MVADKQVEVKRVEQTCVNYKGNDQARDCDRARIPRNESPVNRKEFPMRALPHLLSGQIYFNGYYDVRIELHSEARTDSPPREAMIVTVSDAYLAITPPGNMHRG